MSNEKKTDCTDNGMAQCQDKSCELPATHHLVWHEPTFYCLPHAQKMLMVARVMAYTPAMSTFRQMTPDEMLCEEDES